MIGSVSSGFRRRRWRNASRATVAATTRPAGSRQRPPAVRGDVRGIPACREPAIRSDRCASIALLPPGAPARCDFTLASGVNAAALATRERTWAFAGFAAVPDPDAAGSEATGELSGRTAAARPLAIVGSIALTVGDRRAVASGATPRVSAAGFAAASTAGAASDTGAVAAGAVATPAAVDTGTAATAGEVAVVGAG
jgi:hypothetical protein